MLDYDSIQAFASRVDKEVDRLEYVVLNAGISPHEFRESKYGFESALQVNLISTTLLALLLLPKLMESQTPFFTPVLELVGSGTHQRLRGLLPDTDNPDKDPLEVYNTRESFESFGFLEQYSLSKLFLMYVQWHLMDLVEDESSDLARAFVVVVGPGPTQSAITREFDNRSLLFRMAFSVVYLMMKTAEQGARVYLSGLALGARGHGRFWQWDSIDRCVTKTTRILVKG
jgi:NAD(P)-dependent dehydrogenase (short-subunit alcohol dehydrogenase family)